MILLTRKRGDIWRENYFEKTHKEKMATSALATKSEQQSPQHQTPTKASPSSSSTIASINSQQNPRNTASNVMTTGTYVTFGPVEVSKALQDGEKFVKWDEVS